MAITLNKLVKKKVQNPSVCGMVVEYHFCTFYKVNLLFNGQYRMLELYRFHLARDNLDDIMLLPVILEKFNHIAQIIQTIST
jgi:hypothetical protein